MVSTCRQSGWLVYGVALLLGGVGILQGRCLSGDSAAAVASLQARLQALVGQLQQRAHVGVLVSSVAGQRYFEHRADQLLVPASVTKLFWSAAALAVFGDSAKLRTALFADAPPQPGGIIRGNLYLVGGGDPQLTVQELEELAAQLVRQGIRHITGAVLGDGSLFDGQRNRLQYSGDIDPVEPLPPITALGFNRNEVRVILSTGGRKVVAQTVPVSPAFTVDVSGVRIRAGKRGGQRVALSVRSVLRGRVQQIILFGRVPGRGTWSLVVPIEKPELAAAATFLQRLRAAGIRVDGGFGEGRCPPTATLLGLWERPLVELLQVINKESDNFAAEHLFKLLGARASGNGTQAERARALLQRLLLRWGVPCHGCAFRDGSGLSRHNRVSAEDVVGVLRAVFYSPFADALCRSLAIAGVDGTLRRRLQQSAAQNRVWAKTGTLRNASALAGYVQTADGEPLIFAILSFGVVRQAKVLEDSVVATLARFSFCGTRSQSR